MTTTITHGKHFHYKCMHTCSGSTQPPPEGIYRFIVEKIMRDHKKCCPAMDLPYINACRLFSLLRVANGSLIEKKSKFYREKKIMSDFTSLHVHHLNEQWVINYHNIQLWASLVVK